MFVRLQVEQQKDNSRHSLRKYIKIKASQCQLLYYEGTTHVLVPRMCRVACLCHLTFSTGQYRIHPCLWQSRWCIPSASSTYVHWSSQHTATSLIQQVKQITSNFYELYVLLETWSMVFSISYCLVFLTSDTFSHKPIPETTQK